MKRRVVTAGILGIMLSNSGFAATWESPSDYLDCGSLNPHEASAEYLQIPSATAFSPRAADPQLPWIAKLEVIDEELGDGRLRVQNCVGVAVAPDWILTAGHCVADRQWLRVEATLGAIDLNDDRAIRRTGFAARCKPGFDERTLSDDVALLRLSEPLPTNFPIADVPSHDEAIPIAALAVSGGWRRFDTANRKDKLQRSYATYDSEQADGSIVLKPLPGEQQPICVGESGAPLLSDDGAKPIAVLSAILTTLTGSRGFSGEQCAERKHRLVFEPLPRHSDWIERMIAGVAPDAPIAVAPDLPIVVAEPDMAVIEATESVAPIYDGPAVTGATLSYDAREIAPDDVTPVAFVEQVVPTYELVDGSEFSEVAPIYDAPPEVEGPIYDPVDGPIWDGGS